MIIIHYLLFTNFSIYINTIEDKVKPNEFYEKELKIKGTKNKVLSYQLCKINKIKIYTLFWEQSKVKPDGVLKFSGYIFLPHNMKILKVFQKCVTELISSLLNVKGVKFIRAQDLLQRSAHWMDPIYKTEFTIPNDNRKIYFKCRLCKELHKMKKRSISNEDYYTNYDLLYLSDGSALSSHTTSANEISLKNDIIKNSSIENYFIGQNVRKIVAENSHLTLNCPETTMDSNVQWYKDNEKLNSSYRRNMADVETEPHLTIDSYHSLYILQATKNEEGVYTCYVNDKPFQTYRVIVVSKSKLLNEEFFRYSIYLGFVLSLTITCYCAGICVAWHQRSSFADPLR